MDHSLRGYLERRTTKELMQILCEFRDKGSETWDLEVVILVMEILKKRLDDGEKMGW